MFLQVMSAEADRESILPYIKMFQQLIRYTTALFLLHAMRCTFGAAAKHAVLTMEIRLHAYCLLLTGADLF